MNSSEDQADKSFDPTPQKLLDARKKGEIPRSTEMLTAAAYAGLFIGFLWMGQSSIEQMGTVFIVLLDQADPLAQLFVSGAGTAPGLGLIGSVGLALLPIFLLPMLAVVGVLFATRGIVFAPSKVAPKISKISIISNAKNKYGRNGLFQFFISFVKLLVYSACLAVYLSLRLNDMIAALATEPRFVCGPYG